MQFSRLQIGEGEPGLSPIAASAGPANCRYVEAGQQGGQAGSHPYPLAEEGCFFLTVFSAAESRDDFLRGWKQRKIPFDAVGIGRRSVAA